jgi:FKBP-type peptidyl-prolyl cis-trans isomerase
MKKIYLLALASAFAISANAQTKPAAKTVVKSKTTVKKPIAAKPVVKVVPKPIIKTKLDSASYAFGWSMANNLKSAGLETLSFELVNKGLRDAFSAANPALTEQQCQQAINNIFESYAKVREQNEKKKFEPQIKEGESFLASNKLKSGIKTTASGLQYEVITPGVGQKPKATDQVTVHYKGSLLNGTEFDSSYKRNEPTSFGLNQVIPGWTEGVQLMQEGAKYRFFIPYQLAYGARGAGQSIPPYSTLVFEVELIKVGNAPE